MVTLKDVVDAIYPSIDYNKLLVWSSEQTPPLLSAGYVPSRPYSIVNVSADLGILHRSYAIQTAYTIHYVYDLRHSHDLDTQDTTLFSMTGTTDTDLLKIDYGSTLSVNELYLILSHYLGGNVGTAYVKVSTDGTSWTTLGSINVGSTTETYARLLYRNLSFRYLKFSAVNTSSSGTTYLRVRKVVITT
jgi:hypothetical protein